MDSMRPDQRARRVSAFSALLGGTLGVVLIWAGLFGHASLLALYGGVMLVSLMGVVVFRPRPERVELARNAGMSQESIDRQLATLRTVQRGCWLALSLAIFGALFVFVTGRTNG